MNLHNLYKKQVEAWKERFTGEYRRLWMENTAMQAETDIELELLSSRHQDTIELIEAEIERKKGLKKTHREFECNGAYMGRGCYETWCEMDSCYSNEAFNFRGYNTALDEDIAYLEEELRKLKNEQ